MINYLQTFKKRVGAKFEIAGVVCCMTNGQQATGTETGALAQITSTLEAVPGGPQVFGQYIPDWTDIGRPQAARIGYLVPGAKGDKVRTVFDTLADQVADKMNLPSRLAKAAE